MNILIVYGSRYGNTEKIARAIADGFSLPHKLKLLAEDTATVKDLENIDLLIVGSPTQAGRPTARLQTFFDLIPANTLVDIKVAAFDTRFLEKEQKFGLRLLMKTIGYAAPKIADALVKKGGKLVSPPMGFIVKDQEGPLAEGELERAKSWAKNLASDHHS